MKKEIRIRENSWLALLAAKKLGVPCVAVTVGNTIHLHNSGRQEFLNNVTWMRHEMAHVEQFRKYGFWTFICLYLLESLKKGYYLNKFEIEAREAEAFNSNKAWVTASSDHQN